MFSWDLMVLSRSSDFLDTKVEGWLMEAAVGLDPRMVLGTFPFNYPSCEGSFFLKGTS